MEETRSAGEMSTSGLLASSTSPNSTGSTTTDSETSEGAQLPLLQQLRSAKPSELARKRKVKTNALPVGDRRSQCRSSARSLSYTPQSVTPRQRESKFPDECLDVSGGKLFCTACRKEICLKCQVIRLHIQSKKHAVGKEHLQAKKSKDIDIVKCFQQYSRRENVVGVTLSEDCQVHRIKVVTTFLEAGIPLNKVDSFRDLLEENSTRLAGRRSLSDLILFVREMEEKQILQETKGRKLSVIFDGTTRMGQALAILVRFVDDDFCIQQCLVRLQLLSKSLAGEELAREITVLQAHYKVLPGSLLGAMHDRASVNNVAMNTIGIVFPSLLDIGCMSHTIDHVGDKFLTPVLDDFVTAWVQMFSHSLKSRLLWSNRVGFSGRMLCKTRWWSTWEVSDQLLQVFGDTEPFLVQNDDLAPQTRQKMLSILQDSTKKVSLQIEMAAVVDAGREFVKCT